MRQVKLKIDVTQFIVRCRVLTAAEIGMVVLVALEISQNGPLLRSRIFKITNRRKWISGIDEGRLFVEIDGALHFNEDVFSTEWFGSDRARGHIPSVVKEAIHERDGYRCCYCGKPEGPFHLDHIVPVSRGGSDEIDNLCLACPLCNRKKWSRTPEEMGWVTLAGCVS